MVLDHSPFQNNRKVINFQDKEKAVNVKPQLTHKEEKGVIMENPSDP